MAVPLAAAERVMPRVGLSRLSGHAAPIPSLGRATSSLERPHTIGASRRASIAEVTERLAVFGRFWARSRHEWPHPGRVKQTVLDPNVLGPGSTWELRSVSRDSGGSQVEMVLSRSFRSRPSGRIASVLNHPGGRRGSGLIPSPRARDDRETVRGRAVRRRSLTGRSNFLAAALCRTCLGKPTPARGTRVCRDLSALAPGRISTASRVARPIPRRCPVKATHASVSAGPPEPPAADDSRSAGRERCSPTVRSGAGANRAPTDVRCSSIAVVCVTTSGVLAFVEEERTRASCRTSCP